MSGKFWDKAWSLVDGCTPVSAGCDNCWLAAQAWRFGTLPGYVKNDIRKEIRPRFAGVVRFREDRLDIPLRTKKPTVFAIWSDLYHESISAAQVAKVWGAMLCLPQHTFLIVTKRPHRAFTHMEAPNVYHLVTVENQEMADERIPHALKIPGKIGLLIEPMLGPVDLKLRQSDKVIHILEKSNSFPGVQHSGKYGNRISCVLLGGESGPKARPINPDWARSVRDQCHMAGVPFYLKHIDKKHGRLLDEQEHNELPWRVER